MEHQDSPQKPESDGGLYKHVNIPIRTLNLIIIGMAVLLIGLMLWGAGSDGYHVTYDSKGGSDVEYQTYQFQEKLELPEDPTREGYAFSGWALDEEGNVMAENGMLIEQDETLYAMWEPENSK